jgi:4'-phosphopantetheinyl transferase
LKVQVYFSNVFGLLNVFAKAFSLLSPERKAKCLRYRREDDRLRSLCSGLLIRQYLGITNDEDIVTDELGKPSLKAGKPFISISHAGSLCALAIAEGLIGLDLEYLGREVKGDVLAHRVLTPEEYAIFRERHEDPEYFFSIWTRKESVMKATGKGLTLDPASFGVIPLGKSDHFVHDRKWFFETFEVSKHIFSLCAEHGPLDINLVESKIQDLVPS